MRKKRSNFSQATTINADFDDWSRSVRERLETRLAALLPSASLAPARLHDAMRYSVLGGGKRIRALLCFAGGELAKASGDRLEILAAAIEAAHAYSLVHDDLPCMDDDVLRRGKPTVHVQYDEATGVLVGDCLHSLAFQWLASFRLTDEPSQQLRLIELFAAALGSRGMAGGQAIDLASVNAQLALPELEFMHIHKTGALIKACVLSGALCGEAIAERELEQLARYAKYMGLAFQVVDDVLDAESTTAALGKTAGKDARHNKPTYVSIMGASAAKAFAAELRADALTSIQDLGDRALRLRQIADYILTRQR